MFHDFLLLGSNILEESIDDDMINLYFQNMDSFEDVYGEKIKDFHTKIFNAKRFGQKKVVENLTKQLNRLEREFYIYVSIVMNQKRKEAIRTKILNTLPILTLENPYFREYVIQREMEDQNFIISMAKKTFS